MARFKLFLAAILLSFGISACTLIDPEFTPSMPQKSLKEYNYKAVDDLLAKGPKLGIGMPVLVTTVSNIDNVETASTFGRVVSEQLGTEMTRKGFKVAELKLRQGINIQDGALGADNKGEFLLSRDVRNISGQHKAAAALTGTYTVGAGKVLVNLRLVDIRTGNLIAAHDYEIPKGGDVTALLSEGTTPFGYFKPNYAQ